MRGRLAAPIEGLDQYDFDKLANKAGVSPKEKTRLLAFAHIKDGKSFSETARMLRITPRAVIVWARKFRNNGIEGLRDKYGGGARLRLAVDKHEEFRESVQELQTNRKGGRIRGKDVQELVKTKYNIDYSLNGIYSILKRVGLVWITGRSKHPQSDEVAQATFKKSSKKKSN